MRLARFGGCGPLWWPVGMHQLLVADIVVELLKQPQMEHYALLHDAGEVAGIGDICRPMKTDEQRELEHRILARIFRGLGLRNMKEAETAIVKKADDLAGMAEGESNFGPRGYAETQTAYKHNKAVAGLLANYVSLFRPEDALNPDGRWALEYERRTRLAIRRAQGVAPEDTSHPA